MRVLITGGGTEIPIDDVRCISNFSSGNFSSNLTKFFVSKGIETTLLTSKRGKKPHLFNLDVLTWKFDYEKNDLNESFIKNINKYNFDIYQTYDEYKNKCIELIKNHDIVISAAAVSDFTIEKNSGKISSKELIDLKLKPTEKIIPLLKNIKPSLKVVGFKLLYNPSNQEKKDEIEKILNYNCEFVVYNDLYQIKRDKKHHIEIHNRNYFTLYINNIEHGIYNHVMSVI